MKEIKLEKIPAMADVILKTLQFNLESENAGSEELLNIISKDKGVCTSVLKMSNSPYFGRAGKVKELKDAITLLGLKAVKMLIIASSTKDFATIFGSNEVFKRYFQTFPLLCAFTTVDIMRPLKITGLPKEQAFILGMFFPIGMTVLALNYREDYGSVLAQYEESDNQKSLLELEMNQFLVTNHDVRKKVFVEWNFPTEYFIKPVEDPEFIENATDEQIVLTLSTFVSKRMLNIPIVEIEQMVANLILEKKGLEPSLLNVFNEEYLELITEIPLFD